MGASLHEIKEEGKRRAAPRGTFVQRSARCADVRSACRTQPRHDHAPKRCYLGVIRSGNLSSVCSVFTSRIEVGPVTSMALARRAMAPRMHSASSRAII